MDVSAVPPAETSGNNPPAAKRPKFESPADNDEDICIIEEHINVRSSQVAGSISETAGPSQLSEGDAGEDNQDSKIAEFRNKMLKFQAEASHLRTQLKREQEKAQTAEREKVKADAVREHYEVKYEEERKRASDVEAKATAAAEQQLASAEKKSRDLQKQCARLEMKVQSKEADVECRDKELGNAAKDLNEAQKNVADADQKEAVANARADEADTKRAAVEKEVSDLKQKLEELTKSKVDAERKLKVKITELESRLANTETSEQPSSSTDAQQAEGLNEAHGRIAQQSNEITNLQAVIDNLKKDLTIFKGKATRSENARKKAANEKEDEILNLKEEIVGLRDEIKRLNSPETLLEARLETARLRQAVGRFAGIADKIMMKCDDGGISMRSIPSRPTLPKVLLELKPSLFDEYDCRKEYLVHIDNSLLMNGFASQAEKEQCRIRKRYGNATTISFKNAIEEIYGRALYLVTARDGELEWALIEDNTPYACTMEMNSFVLLQAAQKLSPMLLDFSNRGQPDKVVVTDCEDHLGGGQREYLWCSLPGDTSHQNDFRAEFSGSIPDTHLRIYVDPKYLHRCVIASSDAGSKTVEVAMSENILRLRYGNEHFSLTYYIPTVKPADLGERCYSPIEFGQETFEI